MSTTYTSSAPTSPSPAQVPAGSPFDSPANIPQHEPTFTFPSPSPFAKDAFGAPTSGYSFSPLDKHPRVDSTHAASLQFDSPRSSWAAPPGAGVREGWKSIPPASSANGPAAAGSALAKAILSESRQEAYGSCAAGGDERGATSAPLLSDFAPPPSSSMSRKARPPPLVLHSADFAHASDTQAHPESPFAGSPMDYSAPSPYILTPELVFSASQPSPCCSSVDGLGTPQLDRYASLASPAFSMASEPPPTPCMPHEGFVAPAAISGAGLGFRGVIPTPPPSASTYYYPPPPPAPPHSSYAYCGDSFSTFPPTPALGDYSCPPSASYNQSEFAHQNAADDPAASKRVRGDSLSSSSSTASLSIIALPAGTGAKRLKPGPKPRRRPSRSNGSSENDVKTSPPDAASTSAVYHPSDAPPSSLDTRSFSLPLPQHQSTYIHRPSSVPPGASAFGSLTSPTSASYAFPTAHAPPQMGYLYADEAHALSGISKNDPLGRYIEEAGTDGQKLWACGWEGCDRTFKRPNAVKSHVQTHLGIKPYVCYEQGCGAAFVRKHDLDRHDRIHSGSKEFTCPCGKTFARGDALMRHRQRGICKGSIVPLRGAPAGTPAPYAS